MGEPPKEWIAWQRTRRDLVVPPLDAGYEYGLESPAIAVPASAPQQEAQTQAAIAAA